MTVAATGQRVPRRDSIGACLGKRYLEAGRPPDGVLVSVREIQEAFPDAPRNTISSFLGRAVQSGQARKVKIPGRRGTYRVLTDFGQGLTVQGSPVVPRSSRRGVGEPGDFSRRTGQNRGVILRFMLDHPKPWDYREVHARVKRQLDDKARPGDVHRYMKNLVADGMLTQVIPGIFQAVSQNGAVPAQDAPVGDPASNPEADMPWAVSVAPEASLDRESVLAAALPPVPGPPPWAVVGSTAGEQLASMVLQDTVGPQHWRRASQEPLAEGKVLLRADDNTFWLATRLS